MEETPTGLGKDALGVDGGAGVLHARPVSLLVGDVGHGLEPAVGQGDIVGAGGGVAPAALLVSEIVVVLVFDSILPVVVGLSLKVEFCDFFREIQLGT